MPGPRRSPKPQERQRDPERTRQKILDAAAQEFAAHGFAGARIRAIAERAGVNQQLLSYYFDGKEGLFRAMNEQWGRRQAEISEPGTPLPEQLRRYVRENLDNPEGVRMLAWSGLQYAGGRDGDDPGREARTAMLENGVRQIAERLGDDNPDVDPNCLLIMLMAAAMAPTTMPQVIAGLCRTDPRDPEFLDHYAEQVALLAQSLDLGPEEAHTRA
ncbi:TetR family transcriptional regulator [Actinoplanes sp. NPDC049596]|uniref:TetR/AcrR family transcriptional regulator n=1 Tax=unclassified Actinoplanes TaxID=2626549 RepID=UPI003436F313